MVDIRRHIERFSVDLTGTFTPVLFFVIASAICWNIFNNFIIAQPVGFDPLRYEYYARYGLPFDSYDSSSYRIVTFLEFIYIYLPFYWGYIFFIIILIFLLRFFDNNRIVSLAIFSPITFFYIGQTGKDGIAILGILSAALLATERWRLTNIITVSVILGLAYYIRPAIVLFLPVALVQFRYGTLFACIVTIPLMMAFNYTIDTYQIVNSLADVAADEGSGASAAILRQYTFGYEFLQVSTRLLFLWVSIFAQPLFAIIKFYNSNELFILFEAICLFVFLYIVLKSNLISKFVVSSLPYVIVVGFSSPFYHFRYIAIAYPVIFLYSLHCKKGGFLPKNSMYFNLKEQ